MRIYNGEGAPISTTTEIRYKTRMMKNKLNIQTSFRTHKGAPILQGHRGEFAIGIPLGAPRRLYVRRYNNNKVVV